ncbi:hypothetical protein TRVA0_011S00518 [Trichomonascus vanleenenianus]|uniref:uncharacterized protein n=1 Tax=Trichomonascus vanleenenianus TaxID=2268995 RepID=UPI003EC9DE97
MVGKDTVKVAATVIPIVVSLFTYGVYKFQTKLIYPSDFPEGSRTDVDTPDEYGMPYEDVTIDTPDGEKLKAFLMLQEKDARDQTTVIMLCPNAGNIGHSLPLGLQFWRKGYNVFVFSYRGYGLSTGSTTEAGIKTDCKAVMRYLSGHECVQNIVLYGRSLGGAVGIYMASTLFKNNDDAVRLKGIILENTFLSIPRLVPTVLPVLAPLTFLCTEKWESEGLVAKIDQGVPMLFLSGAQDELVPPSHMKALFESSQSKRKHLECFEKGHHNDTVSQPGYWNAVYDFLHSIN